MYIVLYMAAVLSAKWQYLLHKIFVNDDNR